MNTKSLFISLSLVILSCNTSDQERIMSKEVLSVSKTDNGIEFMTSGYDQDLSKAFESPVSDGNYQFSLSYDSIMGTELGRLRTINYKSYYFTVRVGEWRFYSPNGFLDSIVVYKFKTISLNIDTVFDPDDNSIIYIDSIMHPTYSTKKKYFKE